MTGDTKPTFLVKEKNYLIICYTINYKKYSVENTSNSCMKHMETAMNFMNFSAHNLAVIVHLSYFKTLIVAWFKCSISKKNVLQSWLLHIKKVRPCKGGS